MGFYGSNNGCIEAQDAELSRKVFKEMIRSSVKVIIQCQRSSYLYIHTNERHLHFLLLI